jgi:hypothetical protein
MDGESDLEDTSGEDVEEQEGGIDFYNSGIHALAGITAFRHRVKHPHLQDPCSSRLEKLPAWVEPYSRTGRASPTPNFADNVCKMDNVFKQMHFSQPDLVDRERAVVARFVERVLANEIEVPEEVAWTFGRLRLLARLRALNKSKRHRRALQAAKEKEENARKAREKREERAAKAKEKREERAAKAREKVQLNKHSRKAKKNKQMRANRYLKNSPFCPSSVNLCF